MTERLAQAIRFVAIGGILTVMFALMQGADDTVGRAIAFANGAGALGFYLAAVFSTLPKKEDA